MRLHIRPPLEGHEHDCACSYCFRRRSQLARASVDRTPRAPGEEPPRPLPDWMLDPSLLPKRPPGRAA